MSKRGIHVEKGKNPLVVLHQPTIRSNLGYEKVTRERERVIREVEGRTIGERDGRAEGVRARSRACACGCCGAVQLLVLLLLLRELRLQRLELLLVLREVLRDELRVVDEAHGVDGVRTRLLMRAVRLLLRALLLRGLRLLSLLLWCVLLLLLGGGFVFLLLRFRFVGLKSTSFLHSFKEGLICEFWHSGRGFLCRRDDLVLLNGYRLG